MGAETCCSTSDSVWHKVRMTAASDVSVALRSHSHFQKASAHSCLLILIVTRHNYSKRTHSRSRVFTHSREKVWETGCARTRKNSLISESGAKDGAKRGARIRP